MLDQGRVTGPMAVPHATTVLALKYQQGVVIVGDRRATEGFQVADRRIEKVFKIDDLSAMAIAGAAGPCVEMAKLLIARGAPVNARDPMWNATPLGFVEHGSEHCRSADAEYCAIVDALADAGAQIDPPTDTSYGSAGVKAHLRKILAQRASP